MISEIIDTPFENQGFLQVIYFLSNLRWGISALRGGGNTWAGWLGKAPPRALIIASSPRPFSL
jgi:hypothetical protein